MLINRSFNSDGPSVMRWEIGPFIEVTFTLHLFVKQSIFPLKQERNQVREQAKFITFNIQYAIMPSLYLPDSNTLHADVSVSIGANFLSDLIGSKSSTQGLSRSFHLVANIRASNFCQLHLQRQVFATILSNFCL